MFEAQDEPNQLDAAMVLLTVRRRWVALAEDDDDMRQLIAVALRMEGCEVLEANDGRALLQQVTAACLSPSHRLPDLIITDLCMPDVNGLDVLRRVGRLADPPPLVIITGFGSEEVRRLATELGAVAVLEKPIDFDRLLAVIHRYAWPH